MNCINCITTKVFISRVRDKYHKVNKAIRHMKPTTDPCSTRSPEEFDTKHNPRHCSRLAPQGLTWLVQKILALVLIL